MYLTVFYKKPGQESGMDFGNPDPKFSLSNFLLFLLNITLQAKTGALQTPYPVPFRMKVSIFKFLQLRNHKAQNSLHRAGFPIFLWMLCFTLASNAQTGTLRGIVRDKKTEAPLPGAVVTLEKTDFGTVSDSDGGYVFRQVPAGSYNIKVQAVFYETGTVFNAVVTSGNQQVMDIALEPSGKTVALNEVTIRNNPYRHTAETPMSVQTLSAQEIKSNPGGNFDVSRVIQGFPGVGGTSGSVGGYRNDIIIRGGAPNENVYYLDGIEVPVINHFATQGSAGGPTGIIDISFVSNVDLYTSAFPARYDNPLSGVLQLKQKDANPDKIENNIRLSATELAYSADGPITDKLSFQFSARKSYLQFLFQALKIPIQPAYWDFQYKVSYKINKQLTFYTLAIGAIDDFSFLTPDNLTPENVYILHSNPLIKQRSYTNGYGLKKLVNKGYWNLTFSRNMLDNKLDKYLDNQNPNEGDRTLKLHSTEAENKLRFDIDKFYDRYSFSAGAVAQYDTYTNDFYDVLSTAVTDTLGNLISPAVTLRSNASLGFVKYGIFLQGATNFFDKKLTLSLGIRADGNSLTKDGANPAKQFSPRLAASYKITPKLILNASAGKYYKMPTYTVLGYKDTTGNYVNRNTPYTGCTHLVAGLEYLPKWQGSRITIEGFDKKYDHYPVSMLDGISLANKGGDFNVLGNEPVTGSGSGHSYGLELQVQQKLLSNFFVIFSYTLYKSTFTNTNGQSTPASWDNGNLLSLIGGYKFARNIEIGVKFRYQGGAPYTPFNMAASQANYVTLGTGVPDYTRYNTQRLAAFNSMDLRIDKKWNRKKRSVDLFFDITNAYGSLQPSAPTFTFERTADNKSFLTTDGKSLRPDGSNGIPLILDNSSRVVIPSVGFIVEF